MVASRVHCIPTSGVESISTRGCSNILVLAASGRLNALGEASGGPLLHEAHIHSLACIYMKNSHHHHAPSASSSSSSQSSSSPSSSSHGKSDLSRQRLHQPQRLDQPRQRGCISPGRHRGCRSPGGGTTTAASAPTAGSAPATAASAPDDTAAAAAPAGRTTSTPRKTAECADPERCRVI